MVVLLFLGASQLVPLVIIGDYIGRIYDQTRGRPRYLMRQAASVMPASSQQNLAIQNDLNRANLANAAA